MTMRTTVFLLTMVLIACVGHAQLIEYGPVLAADDFARFGEATTETGALPEGGQAWRKLVTAPDGTVMDNLVRGTRQQLWIGYSSGTVNGPVVWVDGLTIADGVIELTVGASTMGERPHTAIISYRAADGPAVAPMGADAYHLWLVQDWAGSRDMELRHGSERIAAADIADAHDPAASYRVRIVFAGDHHQVSVDGEALIDFWEWEPGRAEAGLLGFGAWYSQGFFDDFVIREAGPPGEPVYGTAGGRIPPLLYQGRPFLPLGTYGRPRAEDLDEFLEAGGNCVIVPTMRETTPGDRWAEELGGIAKWGADNDIAVVY